MTQKEIQLRELRNEIEAQKSMKRKAKTSTDVKNRTATITAFEAVETAIKKGETVSAFEIKKLNTELAMRKKLYPRWIANNGMKKVDAERQIKDWESIIKSVTPVSKNAVTEQQTLF